MAKSFKSEKIKESAFQCREGLDCHEKLRYINILKIIDGVDPYEIIQSQFLDKMLDFYQVIS